MAANDSIGTLVRFLVALALCLGLVGCSDDEPQVPGAATETPAASSNPDSGEDEASPPPGHFGRGG